MNNFEMLISEVFTLADNTTVFVGSVTGPEGDIGPCPCELVSDGQVVATFPTDGEMILKNKASSERAISTTHLVSGSTFDFRSGKLVLRGLHRKRAASP